MTNSNVPTPRTPRERQLEALFPEFLALGTERTYGKIGRKHGIESSELVRHARTFMWPERINQLQAKHNEETSAEKDLVAASPEDANVNRLHLSRLRTLQEKAMGYLNNVVFDKPETALRMLIECMKLQRDILGLSKDKDEDLRAIMLKRLDEMTPRPDPTKPAAPAVPEFPFNPNFHVPPAPESDGPEGHPAPPSGGDHVEQQPDPLQPDGGRGD